MFDCLYGSSRPGHSFLLPAGLTPKVQSKLKKILSISFVAAIIISLIGIVLTLAAFKVLPNMNAVSDLGILSKALGITLAAVGSVGALLSAIHWRRIALDIAVMNQNKEPEIPIGNSISFFE